MDSEEQATGRSQARRIAVIGGGISGLAAAHRLIELAAGAAAPVHVVLFEAGPRFGGVIQTEHFAGCPVEFGADSFITNKPAAVDLCRRLGLESSLIATDPSHRRALVLRNGRPVPIPDGFMLMAPGKLWPVVTSPLFTARGKLRMALECLLPRRSHADDESVASFVRRRLGREALERLVQPLVAGIYTSDPEKLSLRATFPRFVEMERRHRSLIVAARREPQDANGARDIDGINTAAASGSKAARQDVENGPHKSGARYGLFMSLRAGMSQVVEALVGRIEEKGEIYRNTEVSALDRESAADGGLLLRVSRHIENGGVAEEGAAITSFDAVIVALPAHRAARIVGSLDRTLAARLLELEYASSAIVVTGHSLADVTHPLNASGLVVPAVEKRQILSVSFASRKFAGRTPEGRVVLRTFVGGELQPEILSHTDEELVHIVRSELGDIFGVRGEPDFAIVSRHNWAMPQYHVGHQDRVARIEGLLSAHPRLALAGNAYDGVGIPDCVRSGEEAARRVFQALFGRRSIG